MKTNKDIEDIAHRLEEKLYRARDRHPGSTLWVYQNEDLGHPELGSLKFLTCGGEGSTFETPPRTLPDTPKKSTGAIN